MPASPLRRLTKEKTVSLAASIAVNLAMIVAFAGIADIGVENVRTGAALVVVGLSGSQADGNEAEAAKPPAPPPPPAVVQPKPPAPAPDPARPEDRPIEPPIALLQRSEPTPERTAPAPALTETEMRPTSAQLREAAEQQRKVEDAAKARALEQAQNEARAAASDRTAARDSARVGGSGGYKGVVWQHLQRFRRPNSVGAGSTLVRFTIDDRGGTVNLGVARSSGSATFDREALQMVRRAAPFPQPPPGAGRDFVFAIEGK